MHWIIRQGIFFRRSVCDESYSNHLAFAFRQVVWIGFTSTTTDRKQTLDQFGAAGTFFKLKIRYGRDISSLSLFPEECELLLEPNSVFTVQTALSSSEVGHIHCSRGIYLG